MTAPKLGSMVFYTLTTAVSKSQNRRRVDAVSRHQYNDRVGVQTYTGNQLVEGDVYPMMITRVWKDDSVNGQVFLDGNDTIWVTSVKEGDEPGTFSLSDESEVLENPEESEDSTEEETVAEESPETPPAETTPVSLSVEKSVEKPVVKSEAPVKKTASKQTAAKTASKTKFSR